MPRKKIITRRIRRLKPSEIEYIIRGTVAYDAELESDSDHFVNESRKAHKVARDLRGRYKDLAVIVEDMYDEWSWDESILYPKGRK